MLTQIWSAHTDIIFCHFRTFFVLLPHYWPWKLKCWKNVKKHLEILSFYTCVPLIKIICTLDMAVPEIWSSKEGIILNYFVNFKKVKKPRRCHHFTEVYKKVWSSAILFQRCGARWISLLFFILGNFSPFYPLQPKKWKCQKN